MVYTTTMMKKPVLNAIGASAYIALVVSLLHFVGQTQGSKPDTAFAPVAFLSLLTLSTAVMAYFFFYYPLLLLLEGKRTLALNAFAQTLGIFAGFTAIVWILLIAGMI